MNEIKPKEPLFAVMLSALLPGLGQVYSGRVIRGIAIFTVPIIVSWGMVSYFFSPQAKLNSFVWVFLIASGVFAMFILVDAYLCAHAFNKTNQLKRDITFGKRVILIIGIICTYIWGPWELFSTQVSQYIKSNVVQAFKIPSPAMSPTLVVDDRILVDKAIYKRSPVQRGDIIVFIYPVDQKKDFIKRVVGLPGEAIEIRDGKIWVNGAQLESPPEIGAREYFNCECPYGQVGQSVQIPEDSYFVLGDNTASSRDSRYWGFVPKQNVEGKAYKIYYPFERSGEIR